MEYNKENFDNQIKTLEKEFELRKINLIKLFASKNNPYAIGDKITDHIGSIIIEKISYSMGYSSKFPCCVYFGLELKKDGSPRKDKSKRKIFQENIEEI